MRVAVKYEQFMVDPQGQVAGHDAGATLVRRLLRVFPGAQIIGGQSRRFENFDVLPLEFVDAEQTVVINMDVIDSVDVWRKLRDTYPYPKVMNFAWWDTSKFTTMVEQAELALACALFPTFANSERTATGLRESVKRLTVKHLAETARISWVNLGIRLEHVLPREETPVPVVLYPAIYMSPRKQPRLFLDVVQKIAKKTPIKVEARLAESDLVSNLAMELSRQRWAQVGPLLPSRHEYWKALAHTTAFLATAEEESYGLEYIEALVAGAIGVFPNHDWAHAILPHDYPYFYRTPGEAEALLTQVITNPDACRAELDKNANGSFARWLGEHHNDDAFETSISEHVNRWFG